MSHLAQIADRVLNRPLMILPDKLALIAGVLDGRIGIDAAKLEFDQTVDADLSKPAPDASRFVGEYVLTEPGNPRSRKPYRTTPEGVAVIAVLGSLVNRGGWIGSYSGMTSYEGLKHQIGAAARDGDVKSIILDMDTPGGEAVGAFEVAEVVKAASDRKPVIAVVNGMAASAGYAIASAATQIITTSSGISGSIGVVMMHADYSHRMHEAGVVPTLIFAGARKVDGNPYEKLTSEVKAELKTEIDRFYDLFVSSVAKGRKSMSIESIRATEARTFIGADAVAIGLADAVGSFEGALSDLTGRVASTRTKGFNMNDKTDPNSSMTLAQHSAAVGVAVTEATAKAKTEAEADKKAAVEAATSEGKKAGAEEERARLKAITGSEEAKGREAAALNLALNSTMTADETKAVLATMPKTADAARAGGSPIGLVTGGKTEGGEAKADHGWGDIAADLNKSIAR